MPALQRTKKSALFLQEAADTCIKEAELIMRMLLILFFLSIVFFIGCEKEAQKATGSYLENHNDVSAKDVAKDVENSEEKKAEDKINFLLIGNREECEANGGGWLKTKNTAQNEMHYSCHERFDDAGMNCYDKKDCNGQCVPYGVIEGHIAYGKCSEYEIIDSCDVIIQGGISRLSDCYE